MINPIPALDGIRCIAIAMVVASHACGTLGSLGISRSQTYHVEVLGNLGVRIFFVLEHFFAKENVIR